MQMKNILNELSSLNINHIGTIEDYVKFCHTNDTVEGDRHHILPRSLFPQYVNLTLHPWNCAILHPDKHYIAHAMLAYGLNEYSMDCAWYAMNNKNYSDGEPLHLIGAKRYGELIKKRNSECSKRAKLRIVCKDVNTGKNLSVPKDEFYSSDNLVGATKGRTAQHWRVPKTTFTNKEGQTLRLSSDDPRVLSGEFVGSTKGRTTYKNKLGETIFAFKDDPRVLAGEYAGINTGNKFKNPSSKGQPIKINIYDNDNNIKYECKGNFKRTCIENNLPMRALTETRKFDTFIKHTSSNKANKYIGWYCRKIKY